MFLHTMGISHIFEGKKTLKIYFTLQIYTSYLQGKKPLKIYFMLQIYTSYLQNCNNLIFKSQNKTVTVYEPFKQWEVKEEVREVNR